MAPDGRHLVRWLRWAFAVLVVVAVGWALARNWAQVAAHLREVSGASLASGLGLAMLPPVLSMFGWRVLLADLGSPIPRGPAAGMFFIGQLGKYLPGSVWSIVAQAEMGARLRIPRSRTAVAGLIAIGMSAVTALLVGLPVVPLVLGGGHATSARWAVGLALPLALVVLWPRVINGVISVLVRLLRRKALEHELSARAVLRTVGWFLLAWAAAGLQALVLTRDLAPGVDRTQLVLVSVSGFALASALGMFSVLFPAGLGVRDGLLVVFLMTVMPVPAATAVAVLMRFFATVADVTWAAVGWGWARSHHLVSTRAERAASAEPSPRRGDGGRTRESAP